MEFAEAVLATNGSPNLAHDSEVLQGDLVAHGRIGALEVGIGLGGEASGGGLDVKAQRLRTKTGCSSPGYRKSERPRVFARMARW